MNSITSVPSWSKNLPPPPFIKCLHKILINAAVFICWETVREVSFTCLAKSWVVVPFDQRNMRRGSTSRQTLSETWYPIRLCLRHKASPQLVGVWETSCLVASSQGFHIFTNIFYGSNAAEGRWWAFEQIFERWRHQYRYFIPSHP